MVFEKQMKREFYIHTMIVNAISFPFFCVNKVNRPKILQFTTFNEHTQTHYKTFECENLINLDVC